MKYLGILNITVLILFFVDCKSQTKIHFAKTLNDKDQYDVILMGGQSNMVGHGKVKDLKDISFDNIYFFDYGLNENLINSTDNFGIEIGVATELTKKYPNRKFILIKYAIGGASLLDWSPNYSASKAKITGHPNFGNMYKKMLTLKDSITKGLNVKVQAFLWMQGERDARILEAGKNYYKNFKLLIQSIRKDTKNQDLPIILGKINPPANTYPALDIVVNSQIKIAKKLKNIYIIDTNNIEKWSDSLHYSSKGQLELGRKFGEKLNELLK